MADGSVPIVLSPEPFARTTTYVEAPAGCSVRTMLASAITHGHLKLDDLPRTNVYIDGERLDREQALSLVLAEGQVVNVVVEPLGGGGGGKKDIGQILLTIAVIAVSMWVGGPTGPLKAWPMLARQVAAAAVLTAGQMAIAAIFKPETNLAKANDRYALSSASNQYRPWSSMPLALGEVVVAPDLAVKTFTQAQGEDQWIYGILGLHYGPCTAEDLKIGDTLVSSMGAGDVRVAYHLTPGPRSFSIVANDTDQLDLQEELAATVSGSTAVVRAASAEGERFQFDFFMPQGLYFAKDDGRKIAAALTVTIRYRPIDQNGVPTGSGAWTDGLTIPLSSASSDPWRIMRELALPLGRYEFEVKRSKLEDDNAKRKTDIGWTAIRAIAFRKPVLDETLSLIEFAVRASALNQGNLAPFTCRITPICETWTGSAWGAPAPTSNPSAITRWLMTGPAPALPLTQAQADVGLRTWAALCDQYNWKSHIYLTEDRKQDAVMQLLGMNGRASLFWDGTQLVSAPWVEKPAPRQLFAGSNLKDHRWEIVYPDPVHALRVEFQNIDQGGEADEIYVYADGYGETAEPANNILPATLVEALRLEGQQTLERAYRDGRWNLGARLHQRRVDSWSTDIEHIVCRYGDRVRLAWDRVGTANATVRNRLWSGALVSGLRLSQPVRMEPGKTYALDLRLPDQVITGVPIVNPATTADVVTRSILFVDLRNANVSPRGGDLVAFGEPERISEDVEIIGITPGTDLTANMVGIRYVAPLLMAGETGPIPPLQSRLTRDRAMDPPRPTLLGWQANEDGVRVGFSMPPWRGSPLSGFTVRWRQTPAAGRSAAWVPLPDLPANAMTAVTPPMRELPEAETDITSADIEIVAMTVDGKASKPLLVTVTVAVIEKPLPGNWIVSRLGSSPDGSQQSGLLVVGLVTEFNPSRVTIEYGATADGPWESAFDGAPLNGFVRAPILGMRPNSQVWIAITYWSAQGAAPSQRGVIGPYTTPGLVAGDLTPTSPVVRRIDDILVDVDALTADVGEALDEASEAKVLAASNVGARYINRKPGFTGAWTSGQLPTDWGDWIGGVGNTRVAGLVTDSAARFAVPMNADRGVQSRFGFGGFKFRPAVGWWVADFTVTLDAGSLEGAGGLIQVLNIAGDAEVGPSLVVDFFAEFGAGTAGKTYTVSKLLNVTSPDAADFALYAMAAWGGFGRGRPAKTITFHFAGARPADAGEIESGVARGSYASLASRITDQHSALTSATAALSTRSSLLEAKASAPANEFDGADGTQGLRVVPLRWGAADGVLLNQGLNDNGSFALWKTGIGASYGDGQLLGSFDLAGGSFVMNDGAKGAFRVYKGEQLGFSAEVVAQSGTASTILVVPRFYNIDKNGAGDIAALRGAYGSTNFERIGHTWAASNDGYVQFEAYLMRQGAGGATVFADAAIRKMVFARGVTQIPVYGAPGGGVLAARAEETAGALATVQGRQQAWIQKRVIAGQAEAFGEMVALDDNGNVTSGVNFGAKRIGLWNPVTGGWVEVASFSDGKARFSGDVAVNGNLIVDGTINGRNALARDTVTPLAATYAGGVLTLNGTATTRLAEQVIATVGGPVAVNFNGLMIMQHEPAGSFDVTVEMRREKISGDGVNDLQIVSETVAGAGNTADDFIGKWPVMIIDRPGPGVWRYVMNARVSASNMTRKDVLNRFMSAMELRSNN